jgi:alpha-tubulin suppressor-like RCC1 family protein
LGQEAPGISFFPPQKIKFFQKLLVVGVAVSETHSVCYTFDGDVYAWGSNKCGQLGMKNSEVGSVAGNVPGLFLPKKVNSVSKIIAGISHPAAVSTTNVPPNC